VKDGAVACPEIATCTANTVTSAAMVGLSIFQPPTRFAIMRQLRTE
jgi:hypothetical protein